MLETLMQDALNKQFNWEQTASQEYLAMAAWFEGMSLRGFASFMRKQADEEREHALRLFDHISNRGGEVTVAAIQQPRIAEHGENLVDGLILSSDHLNTSISQRSARFPGFKRLILPIV